MQNLPLTYSHILSCYMFSIVFDTLFVKGHVRGRSCWTCWQNLYPSLCFCVIVGAYLCCIKRRHYADPSLWGGHSSSLVDFVSKRAYNILKPYPIPLKCSSSQTPPTRNCRTAVLSSLNLFSFPPPNLAVSHGSQIKGKQIVKKGFRGV